MKPDDDPIVATVVLVVVHVPPGTASESMEEAPTQRLKLPVIANGDELIVTTAVA